MLLLRQIRKYLLLPLLYSLAIALLLEEWLWNTSKRLLARLPLLAVIARLEEWIRGFSPYAALMVFALPSLLLIPVKILAALSIVHGHAALGLTIIVVAKIAGTALVARLYSLTQRALLSLPWFKRCHDKLLAIKDRLIAQLRATAAWQRLTLVITSIRHTLSVGFHKIKNAYQGQSAYGRLARILRKVMAKTRYRK